MSELRVGKRSEQKRRWDRENRRDRCACGAIKMAHRARCLACRNAMRRESQSVRRAEIQRRWKAGESLLEIATALGWAKSTVGGEVTRMRRDGWDVPYRHDYPRKVAA